MRSGDAQESLPHGVATPQMSLHSGLTGPSLPVCCPATACFLILCGQMSSPCCLPAVSVCLLIPLSLPLQCVTSTCPAAQSQPALPAAARVIAIAQPLDLPAPLTAPSAPFSCPTAPGLVAVSTKWHLPCVCQVVVRPPLHSVCTPSLRLLWPAGRPIPLPHAADSKTFLFPGCLVTLWVASLTCRLRRPLRRHWRTGTPSQTPMQQ